MTKRLMLHALLLLVLTLPVIAQDEDEEYYDYDDETEYSIEEPFFSPSNGAMFGPSVEFTQLKPSSLDPDLSGDMVLFGFEGYVILNGWVIGGLAVDATLYDLPDNYDEFSYGYGGFLTGYDLGFLYGAMSIRPSVLFGGGGITMIKKRNDITFDPFKNPGGNEILERFRDESYFLMRPGISLGYKPTEFMHFRASVDYMYPVGGSQIDDLREITYGLHLLFGVGPK